jgi:hypothetical protein
VEYGTTVAKRLQNTVGVVHAEKGVMMSSQSACVRKESLFAKSELSTHGTHTQSERSDEVWH